ncbi:DUF4488 domain-containing protein [Parabacteroides pacaensis]|uniref:DUF4488 domain-containing protein n=1 Tax=Parabacteroides pacaensis TaxID=2086575 RepID=UPI00131AC042|nr:DUF4488 domain-containing protein [Parabacteroides pacaensis]
MKREYVWLVVVILLLIGNNGIAQNTKKSKTSVLSGIWQKCADFEMTQGETPTIRVKKKSPAFKILGKGGEMTNMTIVNPDLTVVTMKGQYEQTSDSTYIERIKESVSLDFVGKENPLKFKILEDKYLLLHFFLDKDGAGNTINKWFSEMWIKVDVPEIKNRTTGIEL